MGVRIILVLTFLISIFHCTEVIKRVENSQKKNGVFSIKFIELRKDNGKVFFLNETTNDPEIEIGHSYVKVKNQKCNYYEQNCDSLIRIDMVFNPEFDLFICKGFIEDGYCHVTINDSNYKVPIDNKFILFEGFQDHFKRYLIAIDSLSPLRKEPTVKSEIIKNYNNYQYEIIEFAEDWVKLQTDTVQFDTIINGWARWKEKEQILIHPIYVF